MFLFATIRKRCDVLSFRAQAQPPPKPIDCSLAVPVKLSSILRL